MILRPYQLECVEAVLASFQTGKSSLVVMPTASGKTVTAAHVFARRPGHGMAAAHREELVFQAQDTIAKVTQERVGVEMADWQANVNGLIHRERLVVGSVQSLHERRLQKFDPRLFETLWIDEAHHAVPGNIQYKRVIDYFQQNPLLRLFGMTATPDRADEEALGQVFDSVAFEYSVEQAMRESWIVPISQMMVRVEGLDLRDVTTRMGDFAMGELDQLLAAEKTAQGIVSSSLQLVAAKQSVVFTAGVAQAHKMAEIFNRHRTDCAVAMDGNTPKDERREYLKRFRNGDFQFLVNCGLFLEGTDIPCIEALIMARPTKSRALYTQMVGRGFRVLPNVIEGVDAMGEFWRLDSDRDRARAIASSLKPEAVVIDFTGNCGEHKLVHCGDVLGGNWSEEEEEAVAELIEERTAEGKATRPQEAIDEVRLRERERAEKAAIARRARLIADAKFSMQIVSPFDILGAPVGREPGWHKNRQPSEKQIAALQKLGIPIKSDSGEWMYAADTRKSKWEKLSFWKATNLMDKLVKRIKENKCSYKQAKLLQEKGESADCSFQEASAIITKLKENNWQMLPETKARIEAEADRQARGATWDSRQS